MQAKVKLPYKRDQVQSQILGNVRKGSTVKKVEVDNIPGNCIWPCAMVRSADHIQGLALQLYEIRFNNASQHYFKCTQVHFDFAP